MTTKRKKTRDLFLAMDLRILYVTIIFTSWISSCGGSTSKKEERHQSGCDINTRISLQEPCNSETNCRFGGECRRVTAFRSGRSTVRYIGPVDERSHQHPLRRRRKGSKRSPRYSAFMEELGTRSHECICPMNCRRRGSSRSPDVGTVCGSNHRTYESQCELRQEACRCQMKIDVKWIGSCDKRPNSEVFDTFIDDETSPLGELGALSSGDGAGRCDTICTFGATCDPDSEDEPCKCNIECDVGTVSYMCGTDGRTYTSECQMRQAECRHQFDIDLLHNGPCTAEEKTSRRAPIHKSLNPCHHLDCNADVIEPLCGSDDVSYPNECLMRLGSCVQSKFIDVQYRGYCHQDFGDTTTSSPTLRTDPYEDPCYEIYCMHGAFCVPDPDTDFRCSCEEICNHEVPDIPTDETIQDSRVLPAFIPAGIRYFNFVSEEIFPTLEQIEKLKSVEKEEDTHVTTVSSESERKNEEIGPDIMILDRSSEVNNAWKREKELEKIPTEKPCRRGRRRHRRGKKNCRVARRRRGDFRRRRRLQKREATAMRSLINETLCGTDGKTYKNECQMRKHGCYRKAIIRISHRGACPIELKTKGTQAETVAPTTTTDVISSPTVNVPDPITTLLPAPINYKSKNETIDTRATTESSGGEKYQHISKKNGGGSTKSKNEEESRISAMPQKKITEISDGDEKSKPLTVIPVVESRIEDVTDENLKNLWSAMQDEIGTTVTEPVTTGLNNEETRKSIKSQATQSDVIASVRSRPRKSKAPMSTDNMSSKSNSEQSSHVALAWGIGLGQLAIIALVAFLWIFKTRRKKSEEAEDSSTTDNKTEITKDS